MPGGPIFVTNPPFVFTAASATSSRVSRKELKVEMVELMLDSREEVLVRREDSRGGKFCDKITNESCPCFLKN